MTQSAAEKKFLKELKRVKECGEGTVMLLGRQPLLDGSGQPFEDDDYLPCFGYEVVGGAQ